MIHFSRILMILAVGSVSQLWAAETVKPGDVVLLKAKIANCDAPADFIDYGEVAESGEIVFFQRFVAHENVRLSVGGQTAPWIAEQLADRLEERDGYRPRTIEILVLSGREIIAAKDELLAVATRKVLFPCNLWRQLIRDPNPKKVPDLPPLETQGLA